MSARNYPVSSPAPHRVNTLRTKHFRRRIEKPERLHGADGDAFESSASWKRRDTSKTRETFNLVFGDASEFEEGQVSMASPIGRALVGKGVGETTILKLPTMTRTLKIVDLKTIHETTGA